VALELVVQKMIPNMVAQYVDPEEIWVTSNYTLYTSRDELVTLNRVVDLEVPFWMRTLGRFRLTTRALRLGVRGLRKLKSGTILAIADRKIFRFRDNELKAVHSFQRGFGPLRQGWCEDADGNCYLGEYFLNNKRNHPVNLIKSTDDGQSWQVVCSLTDTRHIHCVQYDPFSGRIWMGTGDRNQESRISFSEDGGENWAEIGSGDQMFRTVSFIFTEGHVYWGTDSPTIQNHIYRYARGIGEIEEVAAVGGPVHYSATLDNGIKLFARTAEGNTEGKSAEWDRKAHLWASEDGTHWEDIMSWEKDFWHFHLGFGRVYLALGQKGNNLYLTLEALKGVDGMLAHAQVVT